MATISNTQLHTHALTTALLSADLPLNPRIWTRDDSLRAARVISAAEVRHQINLARRQREAIKIS